MRTKRPRRRGAGDALVDEEQAIRTDIEFAVADAQWRYLLNERFADPEIEDKIVLSHLRGENDGLIRSAYEARRDALRAWRRARGIG